MVSKKQIRKAGQRIARGVAELSDYELLMWWRSVHIKPLELSMEAIHNSWSVGNGSILVGRLKRFDTIIEKMQRNPDTQLDRLGDISGCRLIVKSLSQVYNARDVLLGSNPGFSLRRDYIREPRGSGYRGIHIVAKYDIPDVPGVLPTEVQIRTEWQHLWATSVELYDLATGVGLKRGIASGPEARYFRVMADLIYEDRTGGSVIDLREELKHLDGQLQISSILREASESIYVPDDSVPDSMVSGYCLLTLDDDLQTLQVRSYPEEQVDVAIERYTRLEEEAENGRIYLLARASSESDLRMAYPNYFTNMRTLIDWLNDQLR